MIGSAFAQTADNRVLLTIDGEPATVEEFLYIYNKNNRANDTLQQSLDEYLDLFINFKLKVHAAEEAGIDTTAAFLKELESYRKQATPKYMRDAESEEAVIQKVYGRMLWDRQVTHIGVQCPAGATAEDEAAARAIIEKARTRVTTGLPIVKGKGRRAKTYPGKVEDFKAVGEELNNDSTIQSATLWVTPFHFVMPFEEAVYTTEVGTVSEIFRTPYGFHILRVDAEEPHKEVNASHIMKMAPANDLKRATAAKFKIDSLYKELQNGADFATLAKENSDDRATAAKGGELRWFGRGEMVAAFENTAFDMAVLDSYSEPVLSRYGWHIIKLLGIRGLADLGDIREDVMNKIKRSEYRQEIENGFRDKLAKEYDLRENKALLEAFYPLAEKHQLGDSAFMAEAKALNGILFSFQNNVRTAADFAEYIKGNPFVQQTGAENIINEKYNYFVTRELRAHENTRLESKYPDLRNLMREYHDGLLLFEVSLREVWDKASLDTVGITAFFNEHKKEYAWDAPRYKGWVVQCKDKSTMKAAKRILKSAETDSIAAFLESRLNIDSTQYVTFEKGLWKQGDNAAVDKYGFKAKDATFEPSEEFPFVFTYGKKLKMPEVYTDERGKVTADYQDFLEKQWVAELRNKYTVEVNQEVLDSLKK